MAEAPALPLRPLTPILFVMRRLLSLLALLSLLVAPLAAPAAGMSVGPVSAECADQAMGAHDMPASDHARGKPCCIAIPPAIDPPVAMIEAVTAAEHLAFIAAIEPFRLGAGPKAEDPPPRTA